MEHETIIEVKDLVKTYLPPDSDPIKAVRGVSFDIKSRDFAIIYGPSGCGKSTILHMLIGLEPASSGEILLRGDNVTKMNDEERSFMRAEKFGMVYQQSYWVKSLNVWENVALPLLIAGMDERAAKKKALEILAEVKIEKYAYKNPSRLSGGEQQRVGMARALVNNPWIIIADEPTGNLDTATAGQIIELLKYLNKEKHRTIIMVTHNLAYLSAANRKIAIIDGKIESEGSDKIKEQIKEELKNI